jgi:beta-lactamase regulating signal transducer with metallopeptidase domain
MNELYFPVLGPLLVLLIVVPLSALAGKAVLAWLDRSSTGSAGRFGTLRYLLLVAPPFLPVAWAISAGVHQAETGRSVLACLVTHDFEQLCVEPLLFAGLLSLLVAARLLPELVRTLRASRHCPVLASAEVARVRRLIAEHAELAGLELGRHIVVTDESIGGSAALGWWRPVVVVDSKFVRDCDDESLVAAIAHELEHVRRRDPLRYLLLALAVRLNPFGGGSVRREAARWIFEREVQCDRAAVLSGAVPFGLARALVQASRPEQAAIAHLGAGSLGKLRLRIELLLSYAEKRPTDDVTRGASALLLACLVAALAVTLPHVASTGPLDALHLGVERAAAALLN